MDSNILSTVQSFSSMSKLIQSFTTIPKELFLLNNGRDIRLRGRPGPLRPLGVFDLLTEAGKVQPKALNPQTYKGKNASSLALGGITNNIQHRTVHRCAQILQNSIISSGP